MSIRGSYGKKYVSVLLLVLSYFTGQSQNLFASVYAGAANYSGDLQEKRFTFTQSHPAVGFGLMYELNDRLLLRGDFTYGKISAADKYGTNNKSRNLSFYSDITEYSIGAEFNFVNLYKYKVSPYIFTGISLFDFNPYTKTKEGNLIYLAELGTEGQGFYEGRKEYKLRQVSIPLGGGILWAITNNKRIGIVFGFRKTFTDYIDDVSTTYVDEAELVLHRSLAVAGIAYRGDELANGDPYPPGGTIRGNPKSKDWYYFSGITFRIRINPKGHHREFRLDPGRKRKSSTECPTIY